MPDEHISKTLGGLMELESVQRNLYRKNLIVKHIVKRCIGGRVVPGPKHIAYYYGHMQKPEDASNHWRFVPDGVSDSDASTGIDLQRVDDPQQVEIAGVGCKVTFGSLTEPELTDTVCLGHDNDAEGKSAPVYFDTVPINLIVIEDEHGKKRTKVTIPQLGGK